MQQGYCRHHGLWHCANRRHAVICTHMYINMTRRSCDRGLCFYLCELLGYALFVAHCMDVPCPGVVAQMLVFVLVDVIAAYKLPPAAKQRAQEARAKLAQEAMKAVRRSSGRGGGCLPEQDQGPGEVS